MAPILKRTNSAQLVKPITSVENGDSETHRQLTDAQIHHDHAHDELIVPIEGEYEKLNSDLQLAFSESLNPNCYSTSVDYKKVEVLMLYWEEAEDDLKVQKEVDDLKDVFVDLYHYGVTQKTIKQVSNRSAQTQVNAIVAGWVNEHDEMKTLLIVYFAGHGAPDPRRDGALAINGRISPSTNKWLNSVVWNNTEHNLRDIQSDVLEIFDCCYAGSLRDRASAPITAFEYIAACAANDTTKGPGEESFTAALIWALKELAVGSARFTTLNLVSKILEAPRLPEGQQPHLSSRRRDQGNEMIVLHPLTDEAKAQDISSQTNVTLRQGTYQETLTLKFVFNARPKKEDIKNLVIGLNHTVHNNRLNVNRIIYGGVRPHGYDAFKSAVSRFNTFKKASLKLSEIHSQTEAHATALVKSLQEEVQEHVQEQLQHQVHDQVHQEVQTEFEAHTANGRSKRRSTEDEG